MSLVPAVLYVLVQTVGVIASRNELESPFFWLPGKIRNYIYTFVFSVVCILSDNPMERIDFRHPKFRYWSGGSWVILAHLLQLITVSREFFNGTHLLPLSLNEIEVALSALPQLAQRLPKPIWTKINKLPLQTGSVRICNYEIDDEDQWLSDVPNLWALTAFDRLQKVVLTSPETSREPKVDENWVDDMAEKYTGKRIEVVHAKE